MKHVDGIEILALRIGKKFHLTIEIALVLQGFLKTLAREPCLQRVVDDGSLAHRLQGAVDPLRAVVTCHRIDAEGNLHR